MCFKYVRKMSMDNGTFLTTNYFSKSGGDNFEWVYN